MPQPIAQAAFLPVSAATAFTSYSPVVLDISGRQAPLELRVSFPAQGRDLPIILLSHGHGNANYVSSYHGYDPLVDFYASHGFVVIQPSHLDSKLLGLDPTGPEGPIFWKSRAADLSAVLDHLDQIEREVPGLAGRTDRTRIVAVGHSAGGHTVGMLLGMQVTDPTDGILVDAIDRRVTAGVMVAPAGGAEGLSAAAAERFPSALGTDFSTMVRPALVVFSESDVNPVFSSDPRWRAAAYDLSPGPKCLLEIPNAGHSFGGISGYDVRETTDENPERVDAIRRLSWAYLMSQLYPERSAWVEAVQALEAHGGDLARVECK